MSLGMGYGPVPRKVFQLNPGLRKFSAIVFCVSRNVHGSLKFYSGFSKIFVYDIKH